jgi:hypothetical protein
MMLTDETSSATSDRRGQDFEESGSRGQRLEESIIVALQRSGFPELSRVHCRYQAGVLSIFGQVASYYQKQLVQTMVRECNREVVVNNQIRVEPFGRG